MGSVKIDKYILKDKQAILCEDVKTWGEFMENQDRVVKKTEFGDIYISTVFIGLNHSLEDNKILLFETLVFKGPLDSEMERYHTWEEAEAGHDKMCERVYQALCGYSEDAKGAKP